MKNTRLNILIKYLCFTILWVIAIFLLAVFISNVKNVNLKDSLFIISIIFIIIGALLLVIVNTPKGSNSNSWGGNLPIFTFHFLYSKNPSDPFNNSSIKTLTPAITAAAITLASIICIIIDIII
ncbi:MAG: hypothetical protein E6929_11895 [Clostridium sp.]|nr:hypothetical protein [Clostridium sp.]